MRRGMEIGMIGLGRMGGGMADRLRRAGHRVVRYDPHAGSASESGDAADPAGSERVDSLEALVEALAPPRAVWIMIPAQSVDPTIDLLAPLIGHDDVLVDGGNSWYRDSARRATALRSAGVHLLDVGTSGGVWGRTQGYSLMIGGDASAVERLRPVFETLAPAPDAGWGRVGASGAGHFVKMVHNAIEYGMMQAYAEGFALLDARTDLDLDPAHVANIWRTGSVIRSWLLDLLAGALEQDPALSDVAPWVADSGEGRWAVAESIDLAVPMPVITLALQARFRSRTENSYADRMLAVLRREFGGHEARPG
ncbi:MAG TPA: decarboxylating 6-phosphogluconate dehydrogenase [Longimicrobiales bacterium]|nr:decarboxylating 6-phosphogluconate dehydrogenase [Longimicrobiales bacterium]